MLKVGMNL